jgi:hypothetical protein
MYYGKHASYWIIRASNNVQFIHKYQLSEVEAYSDNMVKVYIILPKAGLFYRVSLALL